MALLLAPGVTIRAEAAGEVTAAEEAFDDAVVRLLILDGKIARAEALLEEETSRAARLEEETALAEAQAAEAAADLAEARSRYAGRLAETYKTGDLGWLGILLTSDSLSDLLHRTAFVNRILSQDAALARQVEAAQVRALDTSGRLAQATERSRAAAVGLRSDRDALEEARTELAAVVGRLGDRLEAARAAARAASQRMAAVNADPDSSAGGAATAGPEAATGSGNAGGAAPTGTTTGVTPTTRPATAENGGPPPGGRSLTVKAYAYALRGTTASGIPVAPGVVAVDPRVIPLGTRLWVPGYGEGIAADTGGAIKGNTIDVWMPSEQQARAWGIKTVTIIVYD